MKKTLAKLAAVLLCLSLLMSAMAVAEDVEIVTVALEDEDAVAVVPTSEEEESEAEDDGETSDEEIALLSAEEEIAQVAEVCEHPESETYTVDITPKEITGAYEPVDNDTHGAEAIVTTTYHCNVCDEDFEVEEEGGYTTAPHEFDEDGICTVCGYEYVKCEHENYTPTGDFFYTGEPDEGTLEITSNKHKFKSSAAEKQMKYICDDCGKIKWEVEDVEETVEIEDYHDFDEDGVCNVCEYKNTCTAHDYRQMNEKVLEEYCWPDDAENHSLEQTYSYEIRCTV